MKVVKTVAKITLIGMNNYTDGHIWDGLTTPEGLSKETLVNNIMLQYGEMETLYADPDFMKFAIKTWSDKNAWGMQKALAAINFHYEPLYNYDRTETRTYSGTESGTNTGTVSDQGTNTGTVTDAGSHSNTTGSNVTTSTSTTTDREETNETEHKVSAYDSSTYSPDNTDDGSNTFDETVTSYAGSTASGTDSGTSGNTRTDNLAHANTRTDNLAHAKQDSHTETIRAYGNIGVTTSQQMLSDELQLALYNIYDTFAGIFAYDLLLMVY